MTGMTASRISRLTLTNFRSYRAAQIEFGAALVVLSGPNGAGKTNLIEAISLLAPGRGLRRATLEDVAFSEGDGSWAVAPELIPIAIAKAASHALIVVLSGALRRAGRRGDRG